MKKSNKQLKKGFRNETVIKEAQSTVKPTPKPIKLLWRHLPLAIVLWLRYKIVKALIDRRNRPMPILIYPDERLKRIAEPIDFNKTTREQRMAIVRQMGASLARQQWGQKLGIAAPQIGINQRIIVVRGNVMFNPTWNPSKAPPEQSIEGCYSAPKKIFKVPRAPNGWAKWTNIDGQPFESKLTGLPAIVFQHELDHLDGKCCADTGEEIKY